MSIMFQLYTTEYSSIYWNCYLSDDIVFQEWEEDEVVLSNDVLIPQRDDDFSVPPSAFQIKEKAFSSVLLDAFKNGEA